MPELCRVSYLMNKDVREAAGGGGGADALLLEDGASYLLLESGDRILLESA